MKQSTFVVRHKVNSTYFKMFDMTHLIKAKPVMVQLYIYCELYFFKLKSYCDYN